MLAVAAIYPGEVDKRHCGVACKIACVFCLPNYIKWREEYGRTL